MTCLNIIFKSITTNLNSKYLMAISVRRFQCNSPRTISSLPARPLVGVVILLGTPFYSGGKSIKRLMWLLRLQTTYLEARWCFAEVQSIPNIAKKKHLWSSLSYHDFVYPQAAGMLDLWSHEPYYLPVISGEQLQFETLSTMLLCSDRQLSVHGILTPVEDNERGSVHWQAVWSPFSDVNTAQPVYWESVWPSHSIEWSPVLMFTLTGCIRYSWILEDIVHSNLPILCSFPNYYSIVQYLRFHCLSEIEWSM